MTELEKAQREVAILREAFNSLSRLFGDQMKLHDKRMASKDWSLINRHNAEMAGSVWVQAGSMLATTMAEVNQEVKRKVGET